MNKQFPKLAGDKLIEGWFCMSSNKFSIILILSVFLMSHTQGVNSKEKIIKSPHYEKICNMEGSNNGKKVSPDFLLSLAYRERAAAYMFNPINRSSTSSKLYLASQYFSMYFDCLRDSGSSITSNALYHAALVYLDQQKSADAIPLLKIAKEKNPSNKEFRQTLARAYLQKNNSQDAIQELEKLLLEYPGNHDTLKMLGTIYYDLGKYKYADLYLTAYIHSSPIHLYPNQPVDAIYRILGLTSLELEKFPQAEKYLEAYNKTNPQDSETTKILMNLYFRSGKYRKLKDCAARAGRNGMEKLAIDSLLAEYAFFENKEDATRIFDHLSKQIDLKKFPLLHILDHLNRNNFTISEKTITDFISENPGRISARLALVKLLKSRNEGNKARLELLKSAKLAFEFKYYHLASSLFQEYLAENPEMKRDRMKAYIDLSACHELLGNFAMAAHYLRLALLNSEKEEDQLDQTLRLTNLLVNPSIQNLREARSLLGKVLQVNPENPFALLLNGYIHFLEKQYNKAIFDYNKSIQLFSNNQFYYYYRAMAHEKMNQTAKVIEDLESAVKLNDSNSQFTNYLGYYLADQNLKLKEAKLLLEKTVISDPANYAYQDSLGWVYFKLNDLSSAEHHMTLAMLLSRNHPKKDPVIYEHLAELKLRKKDLLGFELYISEYLRYQNNEEEKKRIAKRLETIKKDIIMEMKNGNTKKSNNH